MCANSFSFSKVLQTLGYNPTMSEVNDMLQLTDVDKTGQIEFSEFLVMMEKMEDFPCISRTWVYLKNIQLDECSNLDVHNL